MKSRSHFLKLATLLALGIVSVHAADGPARFQSRPGSKIRIEGTSNIHDWQVESTLVGGFLEAGPGFPLVPGQAVSAGKMAARVEAFILVRSLKSVEKNGEPYSDKMDEIMHEKLKAASVPRITFQLTELTLKDSPGGKDAPYVCEASGELAVAGVTNRITMPVNLLPLGEGKLKVTGSASVKMTDFKIDPPAPKIALGLIKTGDAVKLSFEWMLAQRAPAAK